MNTPKEDGFRMPGEFEPHKRTWMVFPTRPDNWRNNARDAQTCFLTLAKAISSFEEVVILVPKTHVDRFNELANLNEDVNIRMEILETDDAWIRDTGATFVTNGSEIRGISWKFNAWGGTFDGLYDSWDNDQKVAGHMCQINGMKMYETPYFVLEGGSIHVDGEGTCITTKECLLSKGRNPHMNIYRIEKYLREYLNVEKIIWLDKGVVEDETNGHVDNMACFARPGEVILAWTDDETHPQYKRSKDAYELLKQSTDAKGRKIKIHKLHIPRDMYRTVDESKDIQNGNAVVRKPGERLAASYVNFYMPNGAIVMPFFDDDVYDKLAYKTLKNIFPERKVLGIYSREILLGGGNIHCCTLNEPCV